MGVSHYREEKLRVLIAGGGRVGRETATLVQAYGHRPTIVERDPRIARLYTDDAEGVTVIEGDATERETLQAAGIRDTDIVLALTDDEETNLRICRLAAELAPGTRRIARSYRQPEAAEQPEAVDAFVFPERAGAHVAISQAFGAPVQPVTDLSTRLEVVQIEADDTAPATGQRLADLDLPAKATVITNLETEDFADGGTVIESGRPYLIATHPDAVSELKKLFRGNAQSE
jgi:trk system potassium uptake protein TrkA